MEERAAGRVPKERVSELRGAVEVVVVVLEGVKGEVERGREMLESLSGWAVELLSEEWRL